MSFDGMFSKLDGGTHSMDDGTFSIIFRLSCSTYCSISIVFVFGMFENFILPRSRSFDLFFDTAVVAGSTAA